MRNLLLFLLGLNVVIIGIAGFIQRDTFALSPNGQHIKQAYAVKAGTHLLGYTPSRDEAEEAVKDIINEYVGDLVLTEGKTNLDIQYERLKFGKHLQTQDGILCAVGKIKQGTPLTNFSQSDWKDVGSTTAKGAGKGAIRGAATYLLINGTGIPGPVVSAGITTSFRLADDIRDYRRDRYDSEEVKRRIQDHIAEGAITAGSTLAAMSLCAKVVPVTTPYGKIVQIGAGLVGSYIGAKSFSTIKEFKGKPRIKAVEVYDDMIDSVKQCG